MTTEQAQEAAHTPGPWRFNPATNDIVTAQYAGQIIAHVNGYNDSAEADARIIAAAPAMLAALEAILTIEVRADGLRGSGMVDDSDLKALRVCAGQARRVLALARGKVK